MRAGQAAHHPRAGPHSTTSSTLATARTQSLTLLEEQLTEQQGHEFGTERSRPWACHVPRADLLLLWVFYPGSDDGRTTPQPLPADGPPPPKDPTWGERAFWPANTSISTRRCWPKSGLTSWRFPSWDTPDYAHVRVEACSYLSVAVAEPKEPHKAVREIRTRFEGRIVRVGRQALAIEPGLNA